MTPVEFVAWSPAGNVCFLSNGEGIFAYEMGVCLFSFFLLLFILL